MKKNLMAAVLSVILAIACSLPAYASEEAVMLASAGEAEAAEALEGLGTEIPPEIAEELDNSSGNVQEILDFMKEEIRGKDLNTREEKETAIREAVEHYNAEKGADIEISDDQVGKISDVMEKIDDLGMDYETLLDGAADIYGDVENISDIDLNNIGETIEQNKGKFAKAAARSIFRGIVDSVSGLFRELFRTVMEKFGS